MRSRIIITLLLFILGIGFTPLTERRASGRGLVGQAAALDPNTFPSLGPNPFTMTGVYTINTSKDNATPVLRRPDSTTIVGVFFDPTPPDTTNRDEIAVFTFDSIPSPSRNLRRGRTRSA
jgi:hypothetical protein